MIAGKDDKGHSFYEVGDIRITVLPQTSYGKKPGLRINAYKGKGKAVHQGPEIPIPDKDTAYELLKAIHKAFEEIGL